MFTLVNPPNPAKSVSNKDTMGGLGQLYHAGARTKIPSLDIAYSAAVLRSKAIAVSVLDCMASDMDAIGFLSWMLESPNEYVAIRTSTSTFEWDLQITRLVKLVTGCKTILFGPQVTLSPDLAVRQPFVDAIIVGEPELAFPDIADRRGFAGCEGVWHKDRGEVVRAGSRKPIEDLDGLPFPAWDLLPYHEYDGAEPMRNLRPFVTALTSRGCPYACAYCPYPVVQGRKLRVRSPESVVAELVWLTQSLQVKAVLLRDPEFALQRDRVVGICEGIRDRGLRIAWRCETRIEDLDDQLIALMGKAGCIGINMGIESADPGVLKRMHRKAVPLRNAKRIIEACKRNGMDSCCFFILGLPGEDARSALRTVHYARKLNPTFAQFTVSTPYPGTELRAWAQKNGYIEDQALDSMTSYHASMRNEHLTVEQIRWLQWYASEALALRWPHLVRRILYWARQIAIEVKRWLGFHAKAHAARRLRKVAATSGTSSQN